MTPQIQYLQMMAQRFAGTPVGQWFASQADKAMQTLGAARILESRYDVATKAPLSPIGRTAAGALGLGSAAAGGVGSFTRPEVLSSERQALFDQLSARGAGMPETRPPPPAPAPMSAPVRSTGEAFGPPMYTSTDMSARFSDPPQQYVSSDMSARFLDPAQTERRAVQVARDVVRSAAPAQVSARPTNEGFLSRLFGGPDYQSMNALAEGPARGYGARVVQDGRINWGDPESAADFVRADRADMAMRAGRAEGGGIPEGMMGARPMPMPNLDMPAMDRPAPMGDMPSLGAMGPSGKPVAGAGAGGRDAAINKALEIIHHLVIRGQ